MKNKVTRFKKGDIVRCGGNCVLVTSAGKKNDDYPQFEGVVIMAEKHDDGDTWPVGMYSKTWCVEAFKKVKIKLSKAVYAAVIGV